MTIRSEKIKVTTTGGDGVAVGSSRVMFTGKILAVVLNPHGDLPSTTDTTVKITKDGDSAVNVETVATFTNSGDSEGVVKAYPKVIALTGAGAALTVTGNIYTEFVTVSGVEVDVAQADALTDAVEVEVIYEL